VARPLSREKPIGDRRPQPQGGFLELGGTAAIRYSIVLPTAVIRFAGIFAPTLLNIFVETGWRPTALIKEKMGRFRGRPQ
jgi:hypothetical protein